MSISGDTYFHRTMQQQTSIAGLAALLAQSARSFGWHLPGFHMDIRHVALPRGRDGEFIGTAMGWRAKTVNDWVIHGLARNCPLAERCASTSEPFVWDCDANSATWCGSRLSEEQ